MHPSTSMWHSSSPSSSRTTKDSSEPRALITGYPMVLRAHELDIVLVAVR